MVIDRMAIRTENNQIIQRMILWIKVFMMYGKNLWMFIIATFFAFVDKIPSLEISPNSISFVNCFYRIPLILIFTFIGTIFSFVSLASVYGKLFTTLNTSNKKFRTRVVLSMLFAFIRTIFGWIGVYPNPCKFFTTNRTKCSSFYKTFYKIKFTRTRTRAKKRFIFSALFNIKFFSTYLAKFNNSSAYFIKRFPLTVFTITNKTTKFMISMCNFKFFFTYLTNCYSHPNRITEILYRVKRNLYLYEIKKKYYYG